MLDKLLVTVFSAILMTAIGLHLLLISLPLLRRIEFDAICHRYVLLMDQSGGLPGTAATELVHQLQQRGFYNVSVQAPQQAAYGETMSFIARASFIRWHLTPALTMEESEACFIYEAGLICRILKDFAAVP